VIIIILIRQNEIGVKKYQKLEIKENFYEQRSFKTSYFIKPIFGTQMTKRGGVYPLKSQSTFEPNFCSKVEKKVHVWATTFCFGSKFQFDNMGRYLTYKIA
jgi:hypothetical protein